MKVTFVGHASLLIEAKDVAILTDPWWNGPCFGAQWWVHPAPFLEAIERRPPDYLYVSHGHHDHFHPATLKLFDRTTPVLVARDSDLGPTIRGMGFPVIPIADDEPSALSSEVHCRIVRTYADDSLLTVNDGQDTCVNANDALHACAPQIQDRFVQRLRTYHPHLDYVFCGYGTASHFPNCYIVPGQDPVASAIHRQRHFNRAWARVIHELAPRFGFPFAADVVFLDEDLAWSNEPVHNGERPTDVFQQLYPDSPTMVMDIGPGFAVEDGKVVIDRRRLPVAAADLRARYADAVRRVNRHPAIAPDAFADLLALFRANVDRCRSYLATFPGDYRALIRLKGGDLAIQIEKHGDALVVGPTAASEATGYDITYTTRAAYLRSSLTMPYGHEVLFVGSGGTFEYRETSPLAENLHHELAVMMRPAELCPSPRPAGIRARFQMVKRRIRSLVRPTAHDLYDLRAWTLSGSKTRVVEAR